jgi:hypothetical protein
MSSKEKKEPDIQDYKKYVRQLKGRIQGLKEQNNKLIEDHSKLKNEQEKEIKRRCMDYAMIVAKKVTKIQAMARGKLARNKFKKDLQSLKDRKEQEARPNTNEYVLNRALIAAHAIGMNLEMIFRAADKDGNNMVTIADFKMFLQNIKFRLTRSQLSR